MNLSEVTQKAKNIKAIVFDGDGVLFTGRVLVDSAGERLKERSHIDGQGISLLRASGILVAFISAEASGFLEAIGEKLNNLPSVKSGEWPPIGIFTGSMGKEKVNTIDLWLKEYEVHWEECAYMGDDIGDYEILQKVGLPAAPIQAEEMIKNICLFIAKRQGGNGAIRDLTDFILQAKEIDITKLTRR